jgi:hypothetical protein
MDGEQGHKVLFIYVRAFISKSMLTVAELHRKLFLFQRKSDLPFYFFEIPVIEATLGSVISAS